MNLANTDCLKKTVKPKSQRIILYIFLYISCYAMVIFTKINY